MKNKGQSIVEVLFAVAVVGLVLTGVVTLVIKSININTKSLSRESAVKVANIVMEDLVAKQRNDPLLFWSLQDVSDQKIDGFENYTYFVDFSEVNSIGNCGVDRTSCANVEITVTWPGETTGEVKFSRFFRR